MPDPPRWSASEFKSEPARSLSDLIRDTIAGRQRAAKERLFKPADRPTEPDQADDGDDAA